MRAQREVRMAGLTMGGWRREIRQWLLCSLLLKAALLTLLWWVCFRGPTP
jgi:hypothetical protein